MKFTFVGKNIHVRDNLKEYTTKKISRLEKLFPPNVEVIVTCSAGKINNQVEVSIPLRGRNLRAQVSAKEFEMAIDEVVDILEKQMIKYKTRLKDKSRKDAAFREEIAYIAPHSEETAESEGAEIVIEKTKRFALKPMDAEEAVMEMELMGHNFFVFANRDTEEVNVVYKRNNGTYGLIEPEME